LSASTWAAYSAFTPSQIQSLISNDTDALPLLKPALAKHLARFPSVRNGLGLVENVLLEIVGARRIEFAQLFSAFQDHEPRYGFGDAQVFLHLKRLANAKRPLLTITKGDVDPLKSGDPTNTSFELTKEGEDILSGDKDFVTLNGIDLWLGGVHLQGNQAAWRWDGESKTLISS
jgi:hypothetical protein